MLQIVKRAVIPGATGQDDSYFSARVRTNPLSSLLAGNDGEYRCIVGISRTSTVAQRVDPGFATTRNPGNILRIRCVAKEGQLK